MNEMTISEVTNVRDLEFSSSVICLRAIIDGTKHIVPLDPANCHYAEIMRQVEAGELTIQEAE